MNDKLIDVPATNNKLLDASGEPLASLSDDEATAISSLSVLTPTRPLKVSLQRSVPNRRDLAEEQTMVKMRGAAQQRLRPQIVNHTRPLPDMTRHDLRLLRYVYTPTTITTGYEDNWGRMLATLRDEGVEEADRDGRANQTSTLKLNDGASRKWTQAWREKFSQAKASPKKSTLSNSLNYDDRSQVMKA
jgi:hypothetical protein